MNGLECRGSFLILSYKSRITFESPSTNWINFVSEYNSTPLMLSGGLFFLHEARIFSISAFVHVGFLLLTYANCDSRKNHFGLIINKQQLPDNVLNFYNKIAGT